MGHIFMRGLTLVALLLPSTAFAQAGPTKSDDASASAKIVQALELDCGIMDIGKLAALRDRSATVTIPPQGFPISDSPDVIVPNSRTEANSSATCTAVGEPNLSFTISLPPAAVDLFHTDGATTMKLGTFTISAPTTTLVRTLSAASSTFGGRGGRAFAVGATLTVGAQQKPGVYSGTFPVGVQYN